MATMDVDRIERTAAALIAQGWPKALGLDVHDVLKLCQVYRTAQMVRRRGVPLLLDHDLQGVMNELRQLPEGD